MAGIDKMYFKKKDIPKFYEYLKSIDKDFKEYFPNAESILNYTYYSKQSTPELLDNWKYDEIPVSCFPIIVDKWLAHRKDLHDKIKEQLESQYCNEFYNKGHSNENIFNSPIYTELKEISHKFKVNQHTKFRGRRITKPYSHWSVKVLDMWRWYPHIKRFIKDEYVTPDLLGFDYWWGPCEEKFKSLKAVFRFIRKHGFPKGTKLWIRDWRYVTSLIEIEFT